LAHNLSVIGRTRNSNNGLGYGFDVDAETVRDLFKLCVSFSCLLIQLERRLYLLRGEYMPGGTDSGKKHDFAVTESARHDGFVVSSKHVVVFIHFFLGVPKPLVYLVF
jgi:hypothetical protein